MGTERSTEFETACRCGTGTFRIDDCSVDHAWPTAEPTWYEGHVTCAACSQEYTIEQQRKSFVLVDAAERERCRRRREAVSTRAGQILTEPAVRAAFEALQAGLSTAADKSVAAAYRYLDAAGLISCSVSTFRNHWRGVGHWIKNDVRVRDLPKVFAAVGHPVGELTTWLQQLDALQATADLPAQGPVLYRLP